ncbi:MAG: beta-glucosidase [Treponema sp.]|nr:beta-glucosidase [Treponema sp.]
METQILNWNDYIQAARQVSTEGIVLLENRNETLPYKQGTKLAVFGRIQSHYYKSGTGSGGMVAVDKVINIVDALKESGSVKINEELENIYAEWEKTNPFEEGVGWGKDPWSQKEMVLSKELAERISSQSDAALVIIGRTAGEDKDNKDEAGSWRLTVEEENLLKTVRETFKSFTVVLNTGNIIDSSFVDFANPDAVLLAWQGGMIGGYGVADVLTGKCSPSGRLTDTIAYKIEDYPSHKYFGNKERNFYSEDIYVGYRYFETFAKDKVRYPFGYGLSYTDFSIEAKDFEIKSKAVSAVLKNAESILSVPAAHFKTIVTNIGKISSKQVVQIYVEQPQGLLGKPSRILAAFAKTKELLPTQSETLEFEIPLSEIASFDDTNDTGNRSCYVIEKGRYKFFAGSSVRECNEVGIIEIPETIVTEKLSKLVAPVKTFERFKSVENNGKYELKLEKLQASPMEQKAHRLKDLDMVKTFYPQKSQLENKNIVPLQGVLDGKISMPDFLAQLTDEDLVKIIRGEGMGSPKVTAGTAAAFGGVSESLKAKGVPCGCCTDGPSGLRLDSGVHAFSLPNGTMLACTFNTELITKLYQFTGLEMVSNNVDILLGPGMNIHRHPLNGRNFEYFSEDPLLTGECASAVIRGLHWAGVSGSLKHFSGNNQEYGRLVVDSVISERALREIYLKGFEIAVKKAQADVIMTTYGALNGIWTASNYDLVTKILRHEWGFTGIVMTDWWASLNDEGEPQSRNNFAAMVRAQNDLYMVCPDSEQNIHNDNTEESLKNGTLERAELLRCAENIVCFLMHSRAQKRFTKTDTQVKIINRPISSEDDQTNVEYYKFDGELTVDLSNVKAKRGTSFTFAVDSSSVGFVEITITGRTVDGDVAQVPVSVACNGTSAASFTWNGTNGKWQPLMQKVGFFSKYILVKLFFAQNGLELKDIHLKLVEKADIKDML